MFFKNLEEKCKYYQHLYDYKLMPNGYIVAHLDGRSFSKMIKNNFKKPFDENFINMMNKTAQFLCKNVQDVKCAFVQSDEISLFIKNEPQSDLLFNGRLCKLQSILASMATAEFNKQMILYSIKKNAYGIGTEFDCVDTLYNITDCVSIIENTKFAQFDCKIWNVPNLNEAKAWFLFRLHDCEKNSKQQVAQTWCSHKELMTKTSDEQVEYLKDYYGIDWNEFPDTQKHGRFIKQIKSTETKEIDGEEKVFERTNWIIYSGLEINNFFDNYFAK